MATPRCTYVALAFLAAAALHAATVDDLVASTPERVAGGLKFTEGPVWSPSGFLLFSDVPGNTLYKLDAGKLSVFRSPSHNSNGLAFDGQGRLVACHHESRNVTRTEKDGAITVLASRYEGKRLNSPNDLAIRSDGGIYFTDPTYGLRRRKQEVACQGVYRIGASGKLSLLIADFAKPNGIAFSPDEKTLYVSDSERRHVRAFEVRPDGTITNGRVFADMRSPQRGVPDGMAVDAAGRLYATGPGGTWVFDPQGQHLGAIVTPELPANCCFGGKDKRTLYITARRSVYRVRMKVRGK